MKINNYNNSNRKSKVLVLLLVLVMEDTDFVNQERKQIERKP